MNKQIKLLYIGDICGSVGRKVVSEVLPNLKKQKGIDIVFANAENAAGGRGITRKVLLELESYGVDFFTSGDHVWRQKEFLEDLNDKSLPILRPANFPDDIPYGRGSEIIDLGKKGRIGLINLQGNVFMREIVLDPLRYLDRILDDWQNENLEAIVVDFHAETTSEKAILGSHADGKISLMVGTHTHVPTADAKILPQKTGFITDIGMVGPRDSSLWVKSEIAIHNYKFPFKKAFKIEKSGPKMFNSVLAALSDNKCISIQRCDREIDENSTNS